MSTVLRTAGRFRSRFDDVALVRVVGEVARVADASAPMAVSQVAYDRARVVAGRPGAPTAAASARRLGVSWRGLLQVACDPARDPQRTLSALRRSQRAEVSLEEAVLALRLVSRRLGGAGLNPARYEAERQAMLTGQRRSGRRGELADPEDPPVPSIGQLTQWGSFDELLAAAGLTAAAPERERGVPVTEALERFLTEQGYLVSYELLRRWAAARGFRVRKLRPQRYPDLVSALRAERAARGLWTPERPTPKNERPPDLQPRTHETPVARRRSWDYDDCIDALRRALTELPPGAPVLDQRTYRALAKRRDDLPAPSTITRVAKAKGTTFSAMREEAGRR